MADNYFEHYSVDSKQVQYSLSPVSVVKIKLKMRYGMH